MASCSPASLPISSKRCWRSCRRRSGTATSTPRGITIERSWSRKRRRRRTASSLLLVLVLVPLDLLEHGRLLARAPAARLHRGLPGVHGLRILLQGVLRAPAGRAPAVWAPATRHATTPATRPVTTPATPRVIRPVIPRATPRASRGRALTGQAAERPAAHPLLVRLDRRLLPPGAGPHLRPGGGRGGHPAAQPGLQANATGIAIVRHLLAGGKVAAIPGIATEERARQVAGFVSDIRALYLGEPAEEAAPPTRRCPTRSSTRSCRSWARSPSPTGATTRACSATRDAGRTPRAADAARGRAGRRGP